MGNMCYRHRAPFGVYKTIKGVGRGGARSDTGCRQEHCSRRSCPYGISHMTNGRTSMRPLHRSCCIVWDEKKTRDSVHLCYMRPDFRQGPSTRGLISPRGVALDATWGWLSLSLSLFFLFCLLPAAADRPDLTHGKSMHTPNMDAHRAHPDVKNYADLYLP